MSCSLLKGVCTRLSSSLRTMFSAILNHGCPIKTSRICTNQVFLVPRVVIDLQVNKWLSSCSPYLCACLPPCCDIIVSFRADCCLCRQAISFGSVAPFSVYIAFNLSGFSSLSCLALFYFLTDFNFTASSFGDSFFDQPTSKASKDGAILLLWRTQLSDNMLGFQKMKLNMQASTLSASLGKIRG